MGRFDVDNLSSYIHSKGYYTASEPTGGIKIVKYGPRREEVVSGAISGGQLEYYDSTSTDIQDFGNRVIDHAINGVRSDLSAKEMAVLAEQKLQFDAMFAAMEQRFQQQHQNTIQVFTQEIQRLSETITGKMAPAKPPAPEPVVDTVEALVAADVSVVDESAAVPSSPLDKPLWHLDLTNRARVRLEDIFQCKTVGDVVKLTPNEILDCNGMGMTSLQSIQRALASLGLSLASDAEKPYVPPNKRNPLRTPAKMKTTRKTKDGTIVPMDARPVRKHTTEAVLKWARECEMEVTPEWYQADGKLVGWRIAKVVMAYFKKFGKHPSGNVPTAEEARLSPEEHAEQAPVLKEPEPVA